MNYSIRRRCRIILVVGLIGASLAGCVHVTRSYPVCILGSKHADADFARAAKQVKQLSELEDSTAVLVTRDAALIKAEVLAHQDIRRVWPTVGCVTCVEKGCRNALTTIRHARCISTLQKLLDENLSEDLAEVVDESQLACY